MGTIADKLNLLLNTKAAIKNAIIGKGQAVADSDPFASYPAKIAAIQTGVELPALSNPGTAADLLAGKQLIDQNGNPLTGTISTKSVSDLTADGATVTVPAGYYASDASKSVETATQATPAITVSSAGLITATSVQAAGHVAAGTKSATKQLQKIGSLDGSAAYVTPSTADFHVASPGSFNVSDIYVKGEPNLLAANIKSGVSIFGVEGSFAGESSCKIATMADGEVTVAGVLSTSITTITLVNESAINNIYSIVIQGCDAGTSLWPDIWLVYSPRGNYAYMVTPYEEGSMNDMLYRAKPTISGNKITFEFAHNNYSIAWSDVFRYQYGMVIYD